MLVVFSERKARAYADHFDALCCEGLGIGLGDVAGDSTELELLG